MIGSVHVWKTKTLGLFALALLLLAGCGSSSDATADGGTTADGPLVTPLVLGEAITAPDKAWTWVDFPETRCMDDSATGLGIRLNKASDKLLIVIQGGGACFNQVSCFTVFNKNGFKGDKALMGAVNKGLLNPDDKDNPFADWNMIFIPYCSGDTFTGNALHKTGYMGYTQAGHFNIREYLKRIVPTFKDSSHVVVSGYSAGGFAATFNWVEAREAWGEDKRVDVLNDSGPPMGPKYLSPCLQQRMAKSWNWTDSIPKGCAECDAASGNVTEPALEWAMKYTKKGRHALISSDEDSTIKQFYAFGQDDCANLDGISGNFPTGLYPMGLADLRKTFSTNPGAHAFIIKSTTHTWTFAQSPGQVMSNGVVLRDWINDFLDPTSNWTDVVPK